ncbi:nucleotidyltransferase family protein [Fusicatenibacter saccharivorans]|uniref:nucleotidyltransferase family protein n=1 Tax=Fusicatenibacter saccharivorans TaxID=1150298 RepID=UPI00321A0E37
MQKINKYFLEALKASLNSESVSWTTADVSFEEFSQLYQISNIHNVLSMIFEATFSCEVAQQMPPQFMMMFRRNVIQSIAQQTMKSSEFQVLSDHLRSKGIKPCVVKGIVCRDLYPNPDARVSGDEDVFIPEEQFGKSHKTLTDYGMTLMEPDQDIESIYEVPYVKPGSPLYIELHKHMFPPESEAYGNLNRFFDGIHNRTEKPHKGECGLIEEEINGTKFLTMNHTDNLLYVRLLPSICPWEIMR